MPQHSCCEVRVMQLHDAHLCNPAGGYISWGIDTQLIYITAGFCCHTLNKSRHNLHVRILFILQYPLLLLYQLLLLCQHLLRPQYQLHLQYPLLLHPLCCHRKELQRHHISH